MEWAQDIQKKTNTKFANALKQYGVNEFEWSGFETIKYANRDDLYRLENGCMIKYDSINNGYNSRLNLKTSIGPSNELFI